MNLRSIPCPKCGRRGLHHPDHAHALGYKEPDKAKCRFCNVYFNVDNLKEPQDSNTKTAWVASFEYGRFNLARVTIAKETPKTISVAKHENILGWQYFGNFNRRDGLSIFDTPKEAITYLINKGTEHLHELEDKMRETTNNITTLREFQEKLKEQGHEPTPSN